MIPSKILFTLSLCFAFLRQSIAALPPEGKTQVIVQSQFYKPSKFLTQLFKSKKYIQLEAIAYEQELYKLDAKLYLTEQQKINRERKINNKIKELKNLENCIPDSQEESLLISSIEHAFKENWSFGFQGFFKKNRLINKKIEYPFEIKAFSQIQILKKVDKKGTKLLIASPFCVFVKKNPVQKGIKFIFESYKQSKSRTKILLLEAGICEGNFGSKHTFAISRGIKFKNNFLFLLQSFTDIDRKNPIQAYKVGFKQQVSVIKDNYDKGFSWQIGLFNYTAPKMKLSLYSGLIFSVWRYF